MTDEKVYNIPLRRVFSKTSRRRKSAIAVKAVREFISKTLHVSDVVINPEINEFVWSRGISHPPAKVRVKVRKEGERVFADLVDTSKYAEKKAKAKIDAPKTVEKEAKKTETPKAVAEKVEKKSEETKETGKAA